MADFVQKTVTKIAVRDLASPIENAATFTGIVENVIANNPFGCVPYVQTGITRPAVEKTREQYTARIVYESAEGKELGEFVLRCPTVAAFDSIAARILADSQNATDMGGPGHRDTENESFSATLKCHDANGELYNVVMGRTSVRLNSYSDDAIQNRVETWADSIPELG